LKAATPPACSRASRIRFAAPLKPIEQDCEAVFRKVRAPRSPNSTKSSPASDGHIATAERRYPVFPPHKEVDERSRGSFLGDDLPVHPRVRRTNIIIDAGLGEGDRL